MPPADVADGDRAGNRGSIFPQYIPYFTAAVALLSKIDSSFSGLQVDTARTVLRPTPLRNRRIETGVLPAAAVNFHEVPAGEPMTDTKVPDGLEGCTLPAPDSFVLPDAALIRRAGVCDSNVEFVIFFVFTCSL
jgi:hypothetical protein